MYILLHLDCCKVASQTHRIAANFYIIPIINVLRSCDGTITLSAACLGFLREPLSAHHSFSYELKVISPRFIIDLTKYLL